MNDLPPVEMSVSPAQKYREFLTTRGQRLTQERQSVVEAIFSHHEHFDLEQLCARLAQAEDGSRGVSRATVYRCVKSLEEAGLIRKVARANDREIYEHDYGYPQHDHLICERCGQLTEFRNKKISELLEATAIEYGFRRKAHRLEVYGICAACSKPPDRPQKLNMM